MTVFGRRVPAFASLLVWALVWEVVGRLGLVTLLPPLSEVFLAMGEITRTETFRNAAWITLTAFLTGMFWAVVVGVPLGLLMGRFEWADRLLGMWVNVFVSAPLSALVPVIMLLFGMGQTTVILTVFLFAVWIIALDTRAGVREIPPSLLEMARSFGASRWQAIRGIIVPSALPEILAGIRIGAIRGVKGVVIGQLLVAIIGFGELFELYSRNFLMEEFWALTLILFAAALLLSEAIGWVEHKVGFFAGVRAS